MRAGMLDAPGYGRRIGRTTEALGATGCAAASAVLVDVSPVAIVGVVALIVFHVAVGVKTRRLGRVSRFRPDDRGALRDVRARH